MRPSASDWAAHPLPPPEQILLRRYLEIYGLTVCVEGAWAEVIEAIRLDFAWFEAQATPVRTDLQIHITRSEPHFSAYADATSAFVTPRNVVYEHGGRSVIDYYGRALAIFDRAAQRLEVQGLDAHLVHEVIYLFLLSRIGEHVDSRGLARLHAVALSGAQGAVAVLLPGGGGKTTIALQALRADGVKLLSDDSPLLDRRGQVHPFPLRIGVNPQDAADLPAEHVRRIERMEFHPKLALELSAFNDRIERTPQPLRHLVLGRRSLGRDASLVRVPRRAAVGPLLRESVVGVGLFQGLEFVLQKGLRDLPGKAGVARSRAACCAAALRHADVWRVSLGRDPARNWAALEPLLTEARG
jgi:hypothetical protein